MFGIDESVREGERRQVLSELVEEPNPFVTVEEVRATVSERLELELDEVREEVLPVNASRGTRPSGPETLSFLSVSGSLRDGARVSTLTDSSSALLSTSTRLSLISTREGNRFASPTTLGIHPPAVHHSPSERRWFECEGGGRDEIGKPSSTS